MENVLAIMARGTGANPLGNFSEGMTTARKMGLLQQQQDEEARKNRALEELKRQDLAQGGGGAEEFGLQPYYETYTDEKGKPRLRAYQLSKRGGRREIPGTPAPVMSWQDFDTYRQPMPTRLGQDPGGAVPRNQGQAAGDEAASKVQAEDEARAKTGIGQAESRFEYTVATVNQLRNHPGMKMAGIKGKWEAIMDPQTYADFQVLAQTVNGQTLMGQLDMLRELRPVSNEEAKATAQAAVNLNQWQNPVQFKKGLDFYSSFLERNMQLFRKKAAQQNFGPRVNRAVGAPPAGAPTVNVGPGGGGNPAMEPAENLPDINSEVQLLKSSNLFKTNPAAALQKFMARNKVDEETARLMLGM
jgi:hypothetical protein